VTPEIRHDLANILNNIYAMIFAHERGWEIVPPSVLEQLRLIAVRIATTIQQEDTALLEVWEEKRSA
jgi:hypothetical protein